VEGRECSVGAELLKCLGLFLASGSRQMARRERRAVEESILRILEESINVAESDALARGFFESPQLPRFPSPLR